MRLLRRVGFAAILIAVAFSAAYFANTTRPPQNPAAPPPASEQVGNADKAPPVVRAARSQIGRTVCYDPAYTALDYPMGDVPIEKGVCTDVVVRALRQQGIDLQQLVYQDMKANFPEPLGAETPRSEYRPPPRAESGGLFRTARLGGARRIPRGRHRYLAAGGQRAAAYRHRIRPQTG